MKRNVRTGPGILRRRKIVRVRFPGHLEDHHLDGFREILATGKPLGVGPGFEHRFRVRIAVLRPLGHIVEGVEHEQGVLELGSCLGCKGIVIEQLHQGHDVVAAEHGAEQADRLFRADQRRAGFALGHIGQEGRLYIGRVIHPRGHALREQLEERRLFPGGGRLQELNQLGNLFGRQRLRGQPLLGTLCDMGAIRFEHGTLLLINEGATVAKEFSCV